MRGSTLGAFFLPMHWLNIEIIRTQGPEYTSAEPAQQLAWFHLLLYCAQQENGGVIHGAAEFTDRQWQRLMDVEGATLRTKCALWTWDDGGNLVVWEYPEKQEQAVQAKREGGRKGGRSPKSPASYASSIPSSTPSSTPSRNALTKEKEKEKEEGELKEEQKQESESVLATVSASPRKRADARPQSAKQTYRPVVVVVGLHRPLSAGMIEMRDLIDLVVALVVELPAFSLTPRLRLTNHFSAIEETMR